MRFLPARARRRQGRLDEERIAQNIKSLGGEDPDNVLSQWLYEYVAFALFDAGSQLSKDDEQALSRQVSDRIMVLAPKTVRILAPCPDNTGSSRASRTRTPIDKLVSDGTTTWDGVRNFTARNNLRAMKEGDLAFFYHSNVGKEIVGVAKVLREAYPDPTAKGEDWSVVDFAPAFAVKAAGHARSHEQGRRPQGLPAPHALPPLGRPRHRTALRPHPRSQRQKPK